MVQAFVIRALGTDRRSKRSLDVRIGALAMQPWGIELDLKAEQLDLSRYSREFIEY